MDRRTPWFLISFGIALHSSSSTAHSNIDDNLEPETVVDKENAFSCFPVLNEKTLAELNSLYTRARNAVYSNDVGWRKLFKDLIENFHGLADIKLKIALAAAHHIGSYQTIDAACKLASEEFSNAGFGPPVYELGSPGALAKAMEWLIAAQPQPDMPAGKVSIQGDLPPSRDSLELRKQSIALLRQNKKYKLNSPEIEAIRQYTGSGFSELNKSLRGLQSDKGKVDQKVAKLKSGLDSVFATVSIDKEYSTFRASTYLAPGSDQVGARFTDPGFVSTSLDPKLVYDKWLDQARDPKKHYVYDVIELKAGDKGFFLRDLANGYGFEEELLLNRGCEFEVKELVRRGNILYRILRITKNQ